MRNGKLLFALESDEVGGAMDSEAVAEVKAEVQEAHEEHTESVSEIEELQTQVAEGEAAAETLEDMGEVIEAKVADGEGLSPDAAAVTEVAIESIRNRLGMPKSYARIPALESFKSKHSRVEASKIALESIGDTIKKIWAKIVEVAKMIWEKIKSFFGNLFGSYKSLEKRLDSLKSKASSLAADAKPKEDKIDNKSLAKFFTKSSKTADAPAVIAAVTDLVGSGIAVINALAVEKLESFDSKAALQAGLVETAKKVKGELTKAFGASVDKEKDSSFGPFPGCKALVMTTADEGTFSVTFKDYEDPATDIAALASKSAVEELIGKLQVEVKKGEANKKAVTAAEKSLKATIDFAVKMSKIASNAMDSKAEGYETKKELYSATAKAANANIKTISSVMTKVPSMHFSVVKHGADLVDASISNLKKKD